MAKPFKIFLAVVGAFLLLVVGLAIAVPLMFDPNDHRGKIAEAVKENTGRDFEVGEIDLHVFPWIRVGLADARLGNAAGFGDMPFAQVGEARVGVKLLPLLFDGKVEVSTIKLEGLRLDLRRNAQGVDNWSDIARHRAQREQEPQSEGKAEVKLDDIDIEGIDIRDAALSFTDEQAQKRYRVEKLALKTGELAPGAPFDLELSGALASDAPKAAAELELSAHVVPQLDTQTVRAEEFKLALKGEGMNIAADARLAGEVSAQLTAGVFAVDALQLDADLSGADIPGGKQKLALRGALSFDQGKGTLAFREGQVELAGMNLKAEIAGEGLNGDAPRLSGPITIGTFNPRTLLGTLGIKLDTADANALSQASLSAQYEGSFKSARLTDLNLTLDQTKASGTLAVRDFATQALDFALKLDAIDADRYLPPKKPVAKDVAQPAKDEEFRLPSEALDKLNANGTLDIGQLTLNGIKMSDVRLKLSGARGSSKSQQLSAQLYGGKVDLDNRIAPGTQPAIALKTRLTALDMAPFLKDLADKELLSGLGNVTLDLTTRGQTETELKRALNGDLALDVQNGMVKGFNLAQTLRKGQAALAGNVNYTESEAKQTDFSALTFKARIENGVLKSDSLDGASPAFRVGGAGQIDLVNETIDYLLKPTVVETSSGQGGKGLEQLRGLTIPVRLTGSMFDPKIRLDLESALKQKAGDELHKKYEEHEDKAKEKIREKLNDFLFGKQKKQEPAPAPAPAPTPAPQPAPAPTPAT